MLYGAVEAILDRVQGSNVWLTIGLREGKNREVKRLLGHLGLETGRLIRVSYGPFQIGDLADGEVREIRGRMLRDQLGEKLARAAGADFEAPLRPAAPPPQTQRPRPSHAPKSRKDHRTGEKRIPSKPRPKREKPRGKPARGPRADRRR